MTHTHKRHEQGFALITALIMLVVLGALLTAYLVTTTIDLSTTQSTTQSNTGFYAAEAGLNIRGQRIRNIFQGYNRPNGTSPTTQTPCVDGDDGSLAFACDTFVLNDRDVVTYVEEPAGNPAIITIPAGERFGGLNAQEFRYNVFSDSLSIQDDRLEARLEMVFRSRLVPMFQFAAFYNKDLEIAPGPAMDLQGRIHVNGNLFLQSGNRLDIGGAITVSEAVDENVDGGRLFLGRKRQNTCDSTDPVVVNTTNRDSDGNVITVDISCNNNARKELSQADIDDDDLDIEIGLDPLTVPGGDDDEYGIDIGEQYWQEADLRIALDLRSGSATFGEVIVPSPTPADNVGAVQSNGPLTTALQGCAADDNNPSFFNAANPGGGTPNLGDTPTLPSGDLQAVGWSDSFRNDREGKVIRMLEVDLQAVLDCLHQKRTQFDPDPTDPYAFGIDDNTEGGLVFHLTVLGNDSDRNRDTNGDGNDYGVRIRNGEQIESNVAGAPDVRGLTIVSDQALYVQGNYNRDDRPTDRWVPASFIADSLNLLSSAWDVNSENGNFGGGRPNAAETWMNAAFLSGTDSTGNGEGALNGGNYNGGLENYPRFHENWGGINLNYQGSFVSLGVAEHVDGSWGDQQPHYAPPRRNWRYDTRFNDAANLPPLSPRFVYLVQELFIREFEQRPAPIN